MSLVTESRRQLARWATRAAVRPMAIIPDSHQVKEKKDAERVDFFGDQQAIDSRCVRMRHVTSTRNDFPRRRERFRDDARDGHPRGPGATSPPRPPPRDDASEIRPNDQNSLARRDSPLTVAKRRSSANRDSARQVRAPG